MTESNIDKPSIDNILNLIYNMATFTTPLTGVNTDRTISKAQAFMAFIVEIASSATSKIKSIIERRRDNQVRESFVPGLIANAVTIASLQRHEGNMYSKLINLNVPHAPALEADYEIIRDRVRRVDVAIPAEIQGLFDLYNTYAYPGRDSEQIDDGRVIIAVYELLTSSDGIDFDYSKTGVTEEEQMNFARMYIDTDYANYPDELPVGHVRNKIFMDVVKKLKTLSNEEKVLILSHLYVTAHPDARLTPKQLGDIVVRISQKHLLVNAIINICRKYDLFESLPAFIDVNLHGSKDTTPIHEGDEVVLTIQSEVTGVVHKKVDATVLKINKTTRYDKNTTYNLVDKSGNRYMGIERAFIHKPHIRGRITRKQSPHRSRSRSRDRQEGERRGGKRKQNTKKKNRKNRSTKH